MASPGAIRAGNGEVELGVDQSGLESGLNKAGKTLQSWGKNVAAAGAVVAAAGAAITAPFLYGLTVFGEMGSAIAGASRMTSMSFQEVQDAAAGIRVPMEDLPGLTKKMDNFIASAADGAPEAIHQLDMMGISISELAGMSEQQRLLRFADGITSIGDAAQRVHAQTQVFGRQGMSANLTGGSVGIQARAARNREIGGTLSDADVKLAKDYTIAQKELSIATTGVWTKLGAIAAPMMMEISRAIVDVIIQVQGFVEANRPLLDIVFRVGMVIASVGAAIVFLGGLIYGVGIGLTILASVVGFIGGAFGVLWAIVSSGFGVFGVLSFFVGLLSSGFGLMTLFGWAYAAGSMAWSALTWAYTVAVAAANLSTWGYTAALIAAWIWENIVSLGVTLLITALGALVIAIGIVVLAFGGFLLVGAAIAGIGLAVGFLSTTFGPLLSQIHGFDDAVSEIWEAVASSPIDPIFTAIGDALAWVRDNAMLAWDAIMEFLESSGILTFLGYVAKVAAGVLAIGAALVIGAGYLIYIAATSEYVWSEIMKAWEAVKLFAAVWWEGVKAIGAIVMYVADARGELTGLASLGGKVFDSFGLMADTLRENFSTAFSNIADAASSAFTGIFDIIGSSWESVWESIKSGDWKSAFETATAAAAGAWAHIKFLGLTAFYSIKDAVLDAFGGVADEMRVLFTVVWDKIKAHVYPILTKMLEAFALTAGATPGMNQAGLAAERMAGRLVVVPRTPEQIRADILEEGRAPRDAERLAREDRDLALREGRDADAAAANDRLNEAMNAALSAADEAYAERAAAPIAELGEAAGPGFVGAVKDFAMGTFSADAAMGMSGADTQASRMERLEQQQLDTQLMLLEVMKAIAENGGIRFA